MARDREDLRRFPRAAESIPVAISIDDGEKEFQATVHSTDISLSGVFFASDFFLRVGTLLDLKFQMPNDSRVVQCSGVIVREVRLDERQGGKQVSGFAVRFTEYYADAKTILASSFLIAELDEFIADYLQRRSKRPTNERQSLRDVVIAWEVGKMELREGELDLMRDRIRVDKEGRIRRK